MNSGQNSELLGLHFCVKIKLGIRPATLANCLKIVDFFSLKCPPIDDVTLT